MAITTKAQLPSNIVAMLLEMAVKQEQKEAADALKSEAGESTARVPKQRAKEPGKK